MKELEIGKVYIVKKSHNQHNLQPDDKIKVTKEAIVENGEMVYFVKRLRDNLIQEVKYSEIL